ncbi:WG repeat-containing protein [Peptostreptococcaceae bacterium AGR-M142]
MKKYFIVLNIFIMIFLLGCTKTNLESDSSLQIIDTEIEKGHYLVTEKNTLLLKTQIDKTRKYKGKLLDFNFNILFDGNGGDIQKYYKGHYLFKDISNNYKIIKKDGTIVKELKCDDIHGRFSESRELFYIFKSNDKYGLLDYKGNIIFKPVADEILGAWKKGLFPFRVDNKWGYFDEDGKIIIKPQYDCAETFYCDYAYVTKNNKKSAIDSNNNLLYPFKYNNFYFQLNENNKLNYFYIKKDKGFIILNSKKEIIINNNENSFKTLYDDALTYYVRDKYDNSNVVYENFDKENHVKFSYNYILPTENKKHLLVRNDKEEYAIVDKQNNIIIPFSKFNIDEFKNKYVIKMDNSLKIINQDGSLFKTLDYKFDGAYNDSLFFISKDDKIGLANTNAEIILEPIYDDLFHPNFSDFLIAEINNKEGVLNIKGKTIIPIKYDFIDYIQKSKTDIESENLIKIIIIKENKNSYIKIIN